MKRLTISTLTLSTGLLLFAACGGAEGTSDASDEIALSSPNLELQAPSLNLCPTKPDLAVTAVTANNYGARGWLWTCGTVKNTGGVAWSSSAAQVGVTLSNGAGGVAYGAGFSTLAVGATIQRCGWTRVVGLLRMGHDTPSFGECPATVTVSARLGFDPDLYIDGNPANDDCRAGNDAKSISVDYMVECPW